MSDKVFMAPRLVGPRFDDHTLPVNILEDFTALEDLLIEVAKGIYLDENPNRKRVPKGFSDEVYLKLVTITEGSSIAMFAIASMASMSPTLPLENVNSFSYFEKAKDKIVSIIASVNKGIALDITDYKLLSYFNRIGKSLLDDESIDFGYDYVTKTTSSAILNKTTRKRLLLSSEQKTEYSATIRLFARIPEIDQKNNTFQIETELGNLKCPLEESIKEVVFTAFYEYKKNAYVSLSGTALFSWNDKVQEMIKIDSMDILDPLDISLRLNSLSKLEDNWYEGQGKALNKRDLTRFEKLFNSYFDSKSSLPVIFPKVDGNIQLEWKKGPNNVVIEVDLGSLQAEYFYYNDEDDADEKEEQIDLNNKEGWEQLNSLIKSFV